MSTHWLLDRLEGFNERSALIWQDRARTYRAFCSDIRESLTQFRLSGFVEGDLIAIVGDYSPKVCSLLAAAIINRNIIVPLTKASASKHDEYLTLTEAMGVVSVDDQDAVNVVTTGRTVTRPLLLELRRRGSAGLVLFSSGSSGASKAVLLDFDCLLAKFQAPRPSSRTLVFLQLDHIGGINTLFHVLCNGGALVSVPERNVNTVCNAIERHRVQLLPTTPTFLRMMLMAGAHKRYDLRSLETVTYGTEPMPDSTLRAAREAMPWLRFKQTYGLSELGILPTQSESSDSTWLKLGSDGYDVQIVDGQLWIRSRAAMLGYLNAPDPFEQDGWFNTQDEVEVRGDYIRILGRKSEVINVGGEKVHPSEVESVLLTADNVKDATVFGRPNPVTGQLVCARVSLVGPEDPHEVKRRLRAFCSSRLQRFKIPALIEVSAGDQHSYRFKKMRQNSGALGR